MKFAFLRWKITKFIFQLLPNPPTDTFRAVEKVGASIFPDDRRAVNMCVCCFVFLGVSFEGIFRQRNK